MDLSIDLHKPRVAAGWGRQRQGRNRGSTEAVAAVRVLAGENGIIDLTESREESTVEMERWATLPSNHPF